MLVTVKKALFGSKNQFFVIGLPSIDDKKEFTSPYFALKTFKKITANAAEEITLGIIKMVLKIFHPRKRLANINAKTVPIKT